MLLGFRDDGEGIDVGGEMLIRGEEFGAGGLERDF